MPNLRVTFDKIDIRENGDTAGATWKFEMSVNGQGKSWHPANVEDNTTYALEGYSWDLYVPENGVLALNTGGYEQDSPGFPLFDDHDWINGIDREHTKHDNWGQGYQSAPAQGGEEISYIIYYTVQKLEPQVELLEVAEWIKSYIEVCQLRLGAKRIALTDIGITDAAESETRAVVWLNQFKGKPQHEQLEYLLSHVISQGWKIESKSETQVIISRG